jgi:hypothetical protein
VDIRAVFLGVNLAKEVAGYLGLIETLNAKIDRLATARPARTVSGQCYFGAVVRWDDEGARDRARFPPNGNVHVRLVPG